MSSKTLSPCKKCDKPSKFTCLCPTQDRYCSKACQRIDWKAGHRIYHDLLEIGRASASVSDFVGRCETEIESKEATPIKEDIKESGLIRDDCPVCFMEGVISNLECGHTLCPSCLHGLPDAKCPLCRKPIDLTFGCLLRYLKNNPPITLFGVRGVERHVDHVWKIVHNLIDKMYLNKEDYFYFKYNELQRAKGHDVDLYTIQEDEFQEEKKSLQRQGLFIIDLVKRTEVNRKNWFMIFPHPKDKRMYVHCFFKFICFGSNTDDLGLCPLLLRLGCHANGLTYVKMSFTVLEKSKCPLFELREILVK